MAQTFPITNSAQLTLLIIPWFPLLLATLATVFRFESRHIKRIKLGSDDWLCLGGLVLAWGLQICNLLNLFIGGNTLPFKTLAPDERVHFLKLLGSTALLWVTGVTVTQVCILLFYIRVFAVNRKFRIVCYTVMSICCAWWVSTFFPYLFICDPLSKFWNPKQPGTCLKNYSLCSSTGIIHVVLDLIVLALPVPIIWKLQTARSNKLALMIVFGIGIIATICSILRLSCFVTFVKVENADPSGTQWLHSMFQMVEVSLGVLCACMPILPPVWAKMSSSKYGSWAKRLLSRSRSSTKNTESGWGSDGGPKRQPQDSKESILHSSNPDRLNGSTELYNIESAKSKRTRLGSNEFSLHSLTTTTDRSVLAPQDAHIYSQAWDVQRK